MCGSGFWAISSWRGVKPPNSVDAKSGLCSRSSPSSTVEPWVWIELSIVCGVTRGRLDQRSRFQCWRVASAASSVPTGSCTMTPATC